MFSVDKSKIHHQTNSAPLEECQTAAIGYNPVLIEEAIAELERLVLIRCGNMSIRSGNENSGLKVLYLTNKGELLVEWTIADF